MITRMEKYKFVISSKTKEGKMNQQFSLAGLLISALILGAIIYGTIYFIKKAKSKNS